MSDIVAEVYSAALRSQIPEGVGEGKGSAFWNYGLWDIRTTGPQQASEQLLNYLFTKLPPRPRRLLDVAFGKGESTRRLCGMFGVQNVVGINIAADQLDAARRRGVECELHVMDAAQMQFDSESFDVIVCIEAAFHFRTRAKFIERAHSILRPGGKIIMSDMLLRSGYGLSPEVFPWENQVHSLEEYRTVFMGAGFTHECTEIERTTERQIVPYFAGLLGSMHMLPFPISTTDGMTLSPVEMRRLGFILPRLLNVAECVVVSAEK